MTLTMSWPVRETITTQASLAGFPLCAVLDIYQHWFSNCPFDCLVTHYHEIFCNFRCENLILTSLPYLLVINEEVFCCTYVLRVFFRTSTIGFLSNILKSLVPCINQVTHLHMSLLSLICKTKLFMQAVLSLPPYKHKTCLMCTNSIPCTLPSRPAWHSSL